MAEGYNFERLKAEILSRSSAQDWEVAIKEWSLFRISEDPGQTCLCGYHPITEICTLINAINGNYADVGNVCVGRFMGLESRKVFAGIKRVRKDTSRALNEDSIVFLRTKKLINDWEYVFLQNTRKKRILTEAQHKKRVEINERAIAALGRGFK